MIEIATKETDAEYTRLWTRDQTPNKLFVTHLTPDSATRYEFNVSNRDEKTCVYSKGEGTTPPRTVIEILNDEGYTAENLPNISEEDIAVRGKQVVQAIEWLKKHGGFEPGDLRQFAYDRSSTATPTIYMSVLLMDAISPEKFESQLDAVLAKASQQGKHITKEELLDPRTHNIEFLQKVLIEMRKSLPLEDQKKVIELAEERLNWTGDKTVHPQDDKDDLWETSTAGESRLHLSDEAVKTLVQEGWLDEDSYHSM